MNNHSVYFDTVTYGGGGFIAVSLWGTVVISDDGISWESHQIDYNNSLISITWGEDRFVAVGFNWTTNKTVAICSYNGISWTPSEVPLSVPLFFVAYGANLL